jgi:hypothetical protein
MVEDALVYRTRTGTPALSLDGGRSLYDPRGRKVGAVGVWTEADDDPEEVWGELTDEQRDVLLNILAEEDAKAAKAEADESSVRAAIADFIATAQWGVQKERRIAGRTLYLNGRSARRACRPQLCAGYVKRGGYHIWLLPVTTDEAVALCLGRAGISYWTNSDRAEVRMKEAA